MSDSIILLIVVIITVGVIACVYFVCNVGKKGIEKTGEVLQSPINLGSKVVVEAVHGAERTIKPVTEGVGNVLNSIADRIKMNRAELDASNQKINQLTLENERLKHRQVNVDQITSIFQVAFFQSDFSTRDFVKEIVKKIPGGKIDRTEEIEYLGVYRAKNTQRFGIDLGHLRFRLLPESGIEVSGLKKAELIGNLNTTVEHEHVELRRHMTGGIRPESHEILKDDVGNIRLDRDRKQRDDVHKAITQERTIDQIEEATERMALQFLSTYFSPRGYTIKKSTFEFTDGKSIYQLADELNTRTAQAIAFNTTKIVDYGKQRDHADSEMQQQLEQLHNKCV